MQKNFRTYDLSIQFNRSIQSIKVPYAHKDQLTRAGASISLNLAEGSGKPTMKDRRKFFAIAFGSLRECQAIFEILDMTESNSYKLLDKTAGSLFKLLKYYESS